MLVGEYIKRALIRKRFVFANEKQLQAEIEKVLLPMGATREYRLDDNSIVDFFLEGVAIEVKIKGGRKEIYRQCERYCEVEQVKELVLVTNRAIGFPPQINGKECWIVNLGMAWL